MEFMAHRYFKEARIQRLDIKDGKTEWFLLKEQEVRDGLLKIRRAMQVILDDYKGNN